MHRNLLTVIGTLIFLLPTLQAQEIPTAGFHVPVVEAEPGEQLCLDITATDFAAVMGMEWGLKWDALRLKFDTVINLSLPGMDLTNFNLLQTDEGLLRMSWFSLPDPGLADSMRLFTICYTVKAEADPGFSYIAFDETLGGTEIFTRPPSQPNPFILGNFVHGGVRIRESTTALPLTIGGVVEIEDWCFNGGAAINLEITGGRPPYSFVWTGQGQFSATAQNVDGLSGGEYTVMVTDENDEATLGRFWVSRLQQDYNYPNVAADFIIIPATCGANNGSIELTNKDYYLDRPDGESVDRVEALAAGVFTAAVTNRRTCEVEEVSLSVKEEARIDYDLTIEYDDCGSRFGRVRIDFLSEGDYQISWPEMDSTTLDSLPLGSYEFTVIERVSGCILVIPVEVEGPPFFEIEITEEVIPLTCEGSAGTFAINILQEGNYSLAWSTGATGHTIEVTEPGIYSLTITETEMNCSQRFELEMDEESFDPGGEIVVEPYNCNDGSSLLSFEPGAGSDYNYLWSTGDSTRVLSDQLPGVYVLTITDSATGCAAVKSAEIPDGESPLSVAIDVECIEESTCSNYARFTATVAGGSGLYRFNWSTGATADSLESSSIRVDDQRGYGVEVTDLNTGCTSTAGLLTASCLSGLPTQELRLRLYFTCAEEEEGTAEATLHAEVFSGGVPPYVFHWNSGYVDTSYYLSSIPFDTTLSRAEVTVFDQVGNSASWGVDRTELYGCGDESNAVHFVAPHIRVAPGEPFRYPVRVYQYEHLSRGILTLDWDNCLLRADSLVDYTAEGLNGEPYYVAPAEWLMQGTWEVGLGSTSFPEDMPDTAIVQEIFFTARKEAEGISPFIFSINEPGLFEDGSTAFLRPHHGSITIAEAAQLVTPGDADDNGQVDHFDLLNLGLLYREVGPDRRLGLTGPVEEYGIPWPASTPQSRVNLRFVDCNGDGIIDAEDVSVIANNWYGDRDPFHLPYQVPGLSFGTVENEVPLLVKGDSILPGQINEVVIALGTETAMATAAYGLAFTLEYDPDFIVPSSVEVSLDGSWLTTEEEDTWHLQRNDATNHRVELAITRTDGNDLTGSGRIATLRFASRDELPDEGDVDFLFTSARLIDHRENIMLVSTPVSTVAVTSGGTTSTFDSQHPAAKVRIYPVPAKERLMLETKDLVVSKIQLLNIDGTVLKELPPSAEIEIGTLPPAVYLLRLLTPVGTVVKRWVKQ